MYGVNLVRPAVGVYQINASVVSSAFGFSAEEIFEVYITPGRARALSVDVWARLDDDGRVNASWQVASFGQVQNQALCEGHQDDNGTDGCFWTAVDQTAELPSLWIAAEQTSDLPSFRCRVVDGAGNWLEDDGVDR